MQLRKVVKDGGFPDVVLFEDVFPDSMKGFYGPHASDHSLQLVDQMLWYDIYAHALTTPHTYTTTHHEHNTHTLRARTRTYLLT